MPSQAALVLLFVAGVASESGDPGGPYAACSLGWAETGCAAGFTLYDAQGKQAGYGTPHFGGPFLIYDTQGTYQGYAEPRTEGGLDLYDAQTHWRGTLRFR